jgi:hypothetical protein
MLKDSAACSGNDRKEERSERGSVTAAAGMPDRMREMDSEQTGAYEVG